MMPADIFCRHLLRSNRDMRMNRQWQFIRGILQFWLDAASVVIEHTIQAAVVSAGDTGALGGRRHITRHVMNLRAMIHVLAGRRRRAAPTIALACCAKRHCARLQHNIEPDDGEYSQRTTRSKHLPFIMTSVLDQHCNLSMWRLDNRILLAPCHAIAASTYSSRVKLTFFEFRP